ncbi:MAG: L-lactate permease [Patescibacteria group bacterium]|nr:MAG: L-lactate permease [Patescibacteria group bacterium]
MQILAVIAPIAVLFLSVIAFRRSAFFSATAALLCLWLISSFYWLMTPTRLLASSAKGFFIATEIALIIFGALLIFNLLKRVGFFSSFSHLLAGISKDLRVQVILIGLTVSAFIEGASGFGTPALVVVPLLMSLGFAPILSVTLALIGNSVPVMFGAVGLPVVYGLGSVLSSEQLVLPEFLRIISLVTPWVAALIALILVSVAVLGRGGGFRDILKTVPFALLASLAFSLPTILTARFFGPELPSLVGGGVGIVLIILLIRSRVALPSFIPDYLKVKEEKREYKKMGILSFSPYILLVLLLVLSRLFFSSNLQNLWTISWPQLFGQVINYSFSPFYSIAFIMLITFIISWLLLDRTPSGLTKDLGNSFTKIIKPYFTLILLLAFVQTLMFSGDNLSGFASMPEAAAKAAQSLFGSLWPILAPWLGAIGAFVVGSATVSNLLFANFQYTTALAGGFNTTVIVALQSLGAAAGNMISLHNIVAALTVAGLVGAEYKVIRKTIWPLIIYLIFLAIIFSVMSLLGIF